MASIQYKNLLPLTSEETFTIDVNTKLLPNQGSLVYEYNPLRNYRLNEIRYFYNNRFYTEKELLQQCIISNIIYYQDTNNLYIANYVKSTFIDNKSVLKYETIGFTINGITIGIPKVKEQELYIQESSILNNSEVIQLKVDENNYLVSSNGKFVVGYDSEKNIFKYGSSPNIQGKLIDLNITSEHFDHVSFHFKSSQFYQYLENDTYAVTDRIYKFHPGSLVDFVTDELKFSLEHPVQILPQYAYDGSVNLILTDGYSKPRLINTRFSATGKNMYQIVDRKGNNDTNIYDQGESFDIDTSLYKLTSYIPKLSLHSVYTGGQLPVGNYHFYLTYADADGNETDFVVESGLVSVFIGTDEHSIRQGFRNENSFKGVKLLLTNIDPSYSYINIYYTRATGDILQNSETLSYKIKDPVFITNTQIQEINITGYEEVTSISVADINPLYQVIDSAETITSSKNMLFLGNIQKQSPNYAELQDLALYFTPRLDTSEEYYTQTPDYDNGISNTYYDPNYIYDKVGYWPEEIYRFGIVFILPDNTLTPVFNVRGINNLSEDTEWSEFSVYDNQGFRQYIDINENTHLLVKGNTQNLENSKGVVRFHSNKNYGSDSRNRVFGVKFELTVKDDDKESVVKALSENCKGYFFVRQRRIPTVLCEALSIGIEKHSHHPCIPISGSAIQLLENKKELKKNAQVKLSNNTSYTVVESKEVLQYCPYSSYPASKPGYILESFMNMHREIVNNFEQHIRVISKGQVDVNAMICPDYDLNYPYYNSIFNGASFTLLQSNWSSKEKYLHLDVGQRHAYPENYEYNCTGFGEVAEIGKVMTDVKILGVEDQTPLVGLGDNLYSGVAGINNMGYKFDYIGSENKITEADNIIRGVWGPFLAVESSKQLSPATTYMIMIPGYNYAEIENYFKIRYSDKTSYYAISDRFLLSDLQNTEQQVFYRGDCYICQFTHRMNRNFNDDTAPYNDVIVNKGTWRGENNGDDEDHKPNPGFEVKDGTIVIENFDHINLGDINAAQLGHWVTFQLRSSCNLNIRALDESDVNEVTKIGHGKGFYPYYPISAAGSYKTAEALCINKGYEKSVSERYNYVYPEIPAQKNNFANRIIHSQLANTDAYKNGFRIFKSTNFADYQLTYGSITKLLEWKEGLLIIFEHGVGWLNVNERALISNAAGSNVYLQTDKVLPKDFEVISDCFGSQWKDSIVKTPYAVYGVDTVARKIWKFDNKGLQCISDRTVQIFLNKNISLTERELIPILGLRNVKTHYNRFKNDIMFTFYDDLEDSQEKVWNLCYNENMQQFVTFYSWVPSYSENIYNSFFSFDRQTSKWIAKLGQSKKGNTFSQGIVLSDNILKDSQINTSGEACKFGELSLHNIEYSEITKFELLRDNLQNFKLFKIIKTEIEGSKSKYELTLNDEIPASDLLAELYKRTKNGKDPYIYKPNTQKLKKDEYGSNILKSVIRQSIYFPIYHDSNGRRVELEEPVNKNKIVYILKVGCEYKTPVGVSKTFTDSIAVTLQYNLQFLSTDFWRHGQAGIIDISEKLKPTHWYGKQHPFEFEFIVAKHLANSKIFDNLIIISNSAEPESFHFQIDGDSYDFSSDKAAMYYRQEATEAFYQYHGEDIEYDQDFADTKDNINHRPLYNRVNEEFVDSQIYNNDGQKLCVKSSILPLYYSRINSYNEIEDYYRQQIGSDKNYDALSGGEIVYDSVTNTYKIWSHVKAVNIDGPGGRLRGNMQYNEDKWKVQINPINVRQKNESEWEVPPIVLDNNPIPDIKINDIDTMTDLYPEVLTKQGYKDKFNIDNTKWTSETQVKLRDKYLRIRIRYSGKELAIIQAVQTLFRLSFS